MQLRLKIKETDNTVVSDTATGSEPRSVLGQLQDDAHLGHVASVYVFLHMCVGREREKTKEPTGQE